MKVLIIGKNSFLGSHVGQYLKKKGLKVSGLSLREPFLTESLNYIKSKSSEYQVVLFCVGIASGNSREIKYVNNHLFRLVLGVLSKKTRFIYISSVFSGRDTLYGRSKLEAERDLENSDHKDWFIIRPSQIFGSGANSKFDELEKAIANNWLLPIPYGKNAVISPVYVMNLCQVLLEVFYFKQSRKILIVTATSTISVLKLAKLLRTNRCFFVPVPIVFLQPLSKLLMKVTGRWGARFTTFYYMDRPTYPVLSAELVKCGIKWLSIEDYYKGRQ